MAYQSSKNFGYSKAAHPRDDYNLAVQSLSKRLVSSTVSRLGDTDRNYFNFHSFFSDFLNLQYGVSILFET